jgi:CubicO group peptidase (beta-lactamase class C family)
MARKSEKYFLSRAKGPVNQWLGPNQLAFFQEVDMLKKLACVVLTPHSRRRQRMNASSAVRLVSAAILLSLAGYSGHMGPAVGDAASSEPPSASQPYRYQVPHTLDDGWTTAALDTVGMDHRPIEQMTEAIRRYADWNIHAVLIERDGRLVYEEYFAGEDQAWGHALGRVHFDGQTRHDLRSITKSVVSALVGIALASGTIRSLDEPLLGFFPDPEYAALATPTWRSLTLRHALTMSAGLEWNETLPYTVSDCVETYQNGQDENGAFFWHQICCGSRL